MASGINGHLKTRDAKKLHKEFSFVECEAVCMFLDRDCGENESITTGNKRFS